MLTEWPALGREISMCRACAELAATRQKVVVGDPAPTVPARLVFVGEAPGAQEDTAGRTAAELAEQLAGTVKGYQPCSTRGEGACLRSATNPGHKGVLRVRTFKTLAVVVVCLRTDQRSVDQGCDLVFNHVKATS